jgi:hypothetical protein
MSQDLERRSLVPPSLYLIGSNFAVLMSSLVKVGHSPTDINFGRDQMTFEKSGPRLQFMLEGHPFLAGGSVCLREYRTTDEGSTPTVPSPFRTNRTNRPGRLNESPEART